MRTGKILGLIVGGVLALILIALAAVWLLVNPNDYKSKIAAEVKAATRRDLKLDGDIKLSVFPWIALELGPASLGNPPGFPDQPFVAFTHASVRVKLLPLLSKRLEVGRVQLDGLDVQLLKNEAGKGNWEMPSEAAEPAPATPPKSSGGALAGIEGIKITNARVSYQNISITHFTLETGAFVDNGLVPVTLHVDADRGVVNEHAGLDLHFDLRTDSVAETVSLAAVNLNSVVSRAGQERPIRFSLTAPSVQLNIKAQTLGVQAFEVNAAGAIVSGSVSATHIMDALEATGSVTLAPLVVREFVPRVGAAIPKTRDPKAFTSVSASSEFAYGKSAVKLEKLQATLDDTHLKGDLSLNLDTEAVKFDLTVDTLDVDRYLPPPTQSAAAAPPPTPEPKPASASKPLDANGTLSVGAIHVAPLDLSNVKVTVATNDKVVHIFPIKAQVDGGDYSGDITLDNRATVPALSLDEHLSGIDMGKLVAAESKSMHVTGRGNVNIKATAHGDGADTITKTLNGRFDANVANGAVQGIDLGYELGRAEALIRKQEMPSTPNSKQTKFDAMKLSADITNGVAVTHDLTLSSAVLKVTGQGSANLPSKTLDFSLVADTLRTAGNTPIQIPVKVTGSLSDPTVRPDIEALAKGQLKQKVQEVLQDKLKGLFGKP
jgi:AsmA protein